MISGGLKLVKQQRMLDEMYTIIKKNMPVGTYAFKGGYILKSLLNSCETTKNVRRTTDLDVDISSEDMFDLLVKILTPYMESLKNKGEIYSFTCSRPQIKNGIPISGTIKLRVKDSPNTRAHVICGIDVGVHPLFFGVIQLNDGATCLSLESMLADKFCALCYNSRKDIIRRSKDILDIYLVGQFVKECKYSLNKNIIIRKVCNSRNFKGAIGRSSLELVFQTDYDSLMASMYNLLDSTRVDKSILEYSSAKEIVSSALNFVNYMRGEINNAVLG